MDKKKRRSRIRLIEFVAYSSDRCGSWREYHLLQELNKKDYSQSNKSTDSQIYVDLKSRKLWRLTGQSIPVNEFENLAIKMELDQNISIDKKPSFELVNLQRLKDTFVEWWCR
jgi:hypothetical protein